jgi:hypothetical protein
MIAIVSAEHVMAAEADPSDDSITEEGKSWDLPSRLQQAKALHSFCEPQNGTPRTVEKVEKRTVSTWDISTEIGDAPPADTKHWDAVSQSVRVCGFFAKGHRDVRFHKKKRSRWDKVRLRHVATDDLESTALQSPGSAISSASTVLAVVAASSRKQVVKELLTVESEDPTACPAELDAPRWKEGWLRRKNGREPGQGDFQMPRSTSAPITHEPGHNRTRHGARHAMAKCGGSVDRTRRPAPHGKSFRPRTLSESNAALAGLTSYYKFVKAKHPHVRASSS